MCAPTLTSPIMYASCSETEHGSTHGRDGAARSLGYPPLSTVDALFRAPALPAQSGSGGGSEGAAEAPFDDRAPALPAPSASGGGSEGAIEAPFEGPAPAAPAPSGGRFGRGAEPPPRRITALPVRGSGRGGAAVD